MNPLKRCLSPALAILLTGPLCLAQETSSGPQITYRTAKTVTALVDESPARTKRTEPNATKLASSDTEQDDGRGWIRLTVGTDETPVKLLIKPAQIQDLLQDEMAAAPNDGKLDIEAREKQLDALESDMEALLEAEATAKSAERQDDTIGQNETSGEDTTEEKTVDSWLFATLEPIRSVSIAPAVSPGIMPRDYGSELFATRPNEFHSAGFRRIENHPANVQWRAPSVAYRPLYFEDPWLERHGYHYRCLQPMVSAAKFYGRIPFLPYMKGADACTDCTYSLGMGRPGDCPPHFFTLPKKSGRGLLYQAAFVTGTALLTP